MTKQLPLFLPSQSRTGRTGRAGRGGRGSTPSSHCPPRGLEQAAGLRPQQIRLLPPDDHPQIVHRVFCFFFIPQQTSNHMPLRPVFLPGKQFGVTWSRTAALLYRVWKCPACSSHLHVQPRLHFHGQGLRGALHHLCASGSLWADTHGGGIFWGALVFRPPWSTY